MPSRNSYRNLLSIILFTLITNPSSGRKVRERWSGMSKNLTIRVVFPTIESGAGQKLPEEATNVLDILYTPFKGFTLIKKHGMKVGERLPNGSWDGVIGECVEGRGDMIIQNVNPNIFDSRYDIPGHIGPITHDGTLAILSAPPVRGKEATTLLGFFWRDVEGEFYFYCLVWTILFMAAYTIIISIVWKRVEVGTRRNLVSIEVGYDDQEPVQVKSDVAVMVSTAVTCLWMVMEAFLLTEVFTRPNLRMRETRSLLILTFSLSLCVYYALDLVLWSMLSGELAVDTPPHFIDSISDLIKGSGRNLTPTILTDFGFLDMLSVSTNQDERDLYNHILKYPPEDSRIGFNGEESGSMTKIGNLIGFVSESKIAFIERIFSFSFLDVYCILQPEAVRNLHISKQTFGGGYFTFYYGPHLNLGLVSDLNFHISNIIEMGLFIKGIIQNMLPTLYGSSMVESVTAGFMCQQEVVEKIGNDPRYDPEEVEDFTMDSLFQVFFILVIGLITSGVVVLFEQVLFDQNKNIKPIIVKRVEKVKKFFKEASIAMNPFKVYSKIIARITLKLKKKNVTDQKRKRSN